MWSSANQVYNNLNSALTRSGAWQYKIQEKVYEYRGGWDVNPNDLSEGDSISFKYAIDNPNMIITEMENIYY